MRNKFCVFRIDGALVVRSISSDNTIEMREETEAYGRSMYIVYGIQCFSTFNNKQMGQLTGLWASNKRLGSFRNSIYSRRKPPKVNDLNNLALISKHRFPFRILFLSISRN